MGKEVELDSELCPHCIPIIITNTKYNRYFSIGFGGAAGCMYEETATLRRRQATDDDEI